MLHASAEVPFDQPDHVLWSQLGDFAQPAWIKGVRTFEVTGAGIGASRTLWFDDGAQAVEVLAELGPRHHGYTMPDEVALPVRAYRARLEVVPSGEGCVVRWEAWFEPDGMHPGALVRHLSQLFEVSLVSVKRRLAGGLP
jgi:hypothetical protein